MARMGAANPAVSIALVYQADLPYSRTAFEAGLRAVLAQDLPAAQVLVVDGRGAAAGLDFVPPDLPADESQRLVHLPGTYANRAAMLNAALRAARGEFLLALYNQSAAITLRRSAARTMLAAMRRRGGTGSESALVYGDYERVGAAGHRQDVHLLDWHEGRLRDTFDLGAAILYRTTTLRELGGWNEQYAAADEYDLRLRISTRGRLVHVANRYAGALYTVAAPTAGHNVFDYLLAGKQVQLEMECACTEHLRQTGAYLAPGRHVRRVEYPAQVQAPGEPRVSDCLASIITPVHQRPQFIGRAIESVQAQTEQRVEMLVVVNGGETDPTAAEVRRYMPGGDKHRADKPPVRLLVVDINNLGLCFNYGLQQARGRYYVQLDSDDRLKPDAVEKILKAFDSDPTIGMVIGSYEVWALDEQSGALRRNEEIPVVTHAEWTAENGRNNLLRINGAGAPRAAHIRVIQEVGGFGVNDTPHSRNYGEDYDLVLRISERYAIGRVWEPIYEVIRHSGGTDHSIDQQTIDRNDEAKDAMRQEALRRRKGLNHRDAVTQRRPEQMKNE